MAARIWCRRPGPARGKEGFAMAAMKFSHTQDIVLGCAVVASLTEEALNHQFAALFQLGLIKKALKIKGSDDKMEIDAEILAPSIALGIPDAAEAAQAILKVHLKSGTMKY